MAAIHHVRSLLALSHRSTGASPVVPGTAESCTVIFQPASGSQSPVDRGKPGGAGYSGIVHGDVSAGVHCIKRKNAAKACAPHHEVKNHRVRMGSARRRITRMNKSNPAATYPPTVPRCLTSQGWTLLIRSITG